MPKPEIAGITWDPEGDHITVDYVHGDPEHLIGTELFAAELALKARLLLVATPDDTVRWVPRDPGGVGYR